MRARIIVRVLVAIASVIWFIFWMTLADDRSRSEHNYLTGKVISTGENPLVLLLTAYTPIPLLGYLLIRWAMKRPTI